MLHILNLHNVLASYSSVKPGGGGESEKLSLIQVSVELRSN